MQTRELDIKIDLRELENISRQARELVIDMAATPYGCHIGGSLSVLDILIAAFAVFRNDSKHQIVLSKGHAAAALYAVLHMFGVLKENPALRYGMARSPYTGHPGLKVPGVMFPTGSLGHGIPYALGWALAKKLSGQSGFGIAVAGDGELQEGLCWESFQIAQAKSINNFIVIVDINGGQNDGYVCRISPQDNLRQRFEAFGFDVIEIDGHAHDKITGALITHIQIPRRPLAVLAKTIKAKGIPGMEGRAESHYAVIKPAKAATLKRSMS